jgi:hypothetical protein
MAGFLLVIKGLSGVAKYYFLCHNEKTGLALLSS